MIRLVYSSSQAHVLSSQAHILAEEITDDPNLRVVTPNRNAARSLGVREYSLQHLAQEILLDQKIQIAPPLVAQQLLREAIKRIVGPHDVEGTARTWRPSIQALLQSQPSLPDPEELSERASQLIRVTQEYQKLLHQDNWIDNSEIFWRAIEVNPERRSLIIYGYFDPCADELAFIEEVCDNGSVFYSLYEDHYLFTSQQRVLEQFEKQGWTIRPLKSSYSSVPGTLLSAKFLQENSPSLPNNGSMVAHVYSHPEAEARGVLAQIKKLLHQGIFSREIVIVAVNDTEWGNLLVDIAWEYGISLRLPYKIPIAETRVGAWVQLLLEVIEQQWPFELTTRFLQQPFSRKIGGNLWAKMQEERPTNFELWRSLIQTQTTIDLSPLQLPLSTSRQDWLKRLEMIFDLFELREQAKTWAKESLAYKNLIDGLRTLSQLKDENLTWEAFREEILTSLSLLTTIAAPGREGIELHNPCSIAGAKYDYVFVIDGREGNLPKPIVNDPVLDFYERKKLQYQGINLDSAAELARREAFAFYSLLHTPNKQFTFSYSTVSRENGFYSQAEPSSYFHRLGLIPSAVPLEIIPSKEVARQIYLRRENKWDDALLQQAIAAFRIEKHRESSEPFNEYDGVVGIPFDYSEHWFSASQLTQLGQCPFKWFANKLLKLDELTEQEEELSPSLKGTLYHKVLELALKDLNKDPSIDIADKENLQNWFVQAETEINLPKFPAWNSQRYEHIKTLQRTIQKSDFLPEEAKVLALEAEFQGEWQGLKIRGRVDRLDHRESGLVLIDYKTRSKEPLGIQDANRKAKIDLQLPIYQAVAAPHLHPNKTVEKTLYYSLSKGKDISPKIVISQDELSEIVDRLKTHFQGSYPVAPDIDGEACKYCPHDPVCRKGDRLQRKGV
ncbi:MAG: PD-(D/E)XK nuclease family protein [Snowella sp.]|nr:PD-(D/E)XK nuclease family protein [Snowella sp.]